MKEFHMYFHKLYDEVKSIESQLLPLRAKIRLQRYLNPIVNNFKSTDIVKLIVTEIF